MLKHDVIPAVQLLDQYEPGASFFWSSPAGTLLAKGERARLLQGGENFQESLPRQVEELLEQTKKFLYGPAVVVGAIPFDYSKPAELIVPLSVEWAEPFRVQDAEPADKVTARYELTPVPAPKSYEQGVNEVLQHLASGAAQKIVLSRTLLVKSPTTIDVQRLLRNLARNNAKGFTFAVNLPPSCVDAAKGTGAQSASDPSAGTGYRTLLGASPELLISKKGLQVRSNPLAGSTPRSTDLAEDVRRAAALLNSEKDRYEHKVVIEAVAAAMRPYCKNLNVPAEPSLVQTDTMWHLSTEITGELLDHSTSVLELAVALHPTPAICGTPTELAREAILDIEPFDRGFYTGMVGWCDSNGDGEWAVTIRCAEVEGHSMRVFAEQALWKALRLRQSLLRRQPNFKRF